MALSGKAIGAWYLGHKWTSLICMVFMLMFCTTGLPVIFHHEIDELSQAPELSETVPEQARARRGHPIHLLAR